MVCTWLEPLGEDDGDGEDGGRRIFPEHPCPFLHAPRDNISCKGNSSLRHIYIYIYIYIYILYVLVHLAILRVPL